MPGSNDKDLRISGRRLGKEVVVEPVNDDNYIDVNDEPSDDDFVDLGRNSPYASRLQRNGRNKDKEVYDSDHAKTVASGSKGLQRNGRNKDKEVYDSDHAKTVASGSKGKGEKQGRKRSRQTTMPEAEKKAASDKPAGLYVVDNFDENKMEIKLSKSSIVITKDMIKEMLGLKNKGLDILEGNPNRHDEMVRNWKQQYGDAKEIKPAYVKMRMRKSKEADLNFKLNFIVLFTSIMGNIRQKGMCYVDGTKCNDNIVYRRRPPTKAWIAKLLSEKEAKELNCEGFGHEELEEDFVVEEGDPIPNNI
nr:hypothetical protein [Tanacetum cinerariifolium]